jgi:hypothetical protein
MDHFHSWHGRFFYHLVFTSKSKEIPSQLCLNQNTFERLSDPAIQIFHPQCNGNQGFFFNPFTYFFFRFQLLES